MKKYFNFLAIFIILLIIGSIAISQEKKLIPDVFSVIHSRKSVRNFTGEAVSKADLEKILKAGMAAPTAMNKQPWSFIAVTDRKTLDLLNDSLPSAKMLKKAGAAIIVCVVPKNPNSTDISIVDCSLAGENILLAIEALGLGATWTAAYPDKNRINTVRKILNIPEDIIPLNVIPIGHPTGVDKPKDKFKSENIHWEKW